MTSGDRAMARADARTLLMAHTALVAAAITWFWVQLAPGPDLREAAAGWLTAVLAAQYLLGWVLGGFITASGWHSQLLTAASSTVGAWPLLIVGNAMLHGALDVLVLHQALIILTTVLHLRSQQFIAHILTAESPLQTFCRGALLWAPPLLLWQLPILLPVQS